MTPVLEAGARVKANARANNESSSPNGAFIPLSRNLSGHRGGPGAVCAGDRSTEHKTQSRLDFPAETIPARKNRGSIDRADCERVVGRARLWFGALRKHARLLLRRGSGGRGGKMSGGITRALA